MKKLIIPLVIILTVLAYFLWPEKVITYPAGITAPSEPTQRMLSQPKLWEKGEYHFKALAAYEIKARVLSRNNFSVGKESEISPVDFALGWGPMSDQNVIDKIEISQSNRWYHWETDEYPIPSDQIALNSANVHIIPRDENIEVKLDNVYKGSLIEMKGYLVQINTSDGWHWKSSLRRDDTAGGACELFWVEEITIFDKE